MPNGRVTMKNILVLTLLTLSFLTPQVSLAKGPSVRVKEITSIEGVRENMLIGYGLVVGLTGTGDSSNSIPFTRQTLVNILERMGLNAKAQEDAINSQNVAAVMVTAELPAFSRQGSRLDITVSSLGDADSLEGGMLLVTPLVGADGETYAVAQGPVILGGYAADGAAGQVTKNHTTVGRIANGAIVERETGFELADNKRLRLMLKNPDFTTAMRLSDEINNMFGEQAARALDNQTIDINIPTRFDDYRVAAIQKIENLHISPDMASKVVVDEKTGTVVMGDNVRISKVAISHANLTIRVSELPQIVQPDPFSDGDTAAVPRTSIEIDEGEGGFNVLDTGATLADLVDGLNALGVDPRDIISILQTIKASGALQAEIELL